MGNNGSVAASDISGQNAINAMERVRSSPLCELRLSFGLFERQLCGEETIPLDDDFWVSSIYALDFGWHEEANRFIDEQCARFSTLARFPLDWADCSCLRVPQSLTTPTTCATW